MTDRQFRLLLGPILLLALYFDQFTALAGIIAFLVFEGLTNWRLPLLLARLRGQAPLTAPADVADVTAPAHPSIPFDAERAFRLVVAAMLFLSLFGLRDYLWWLAWFIAFAVFGAGVSGVCPMLIFLRLAGFR